MQGVITIHLYSSHGLIYQAPSEVSFLSKVFARLAALSAFLGILLISIYLAPAYISGYRQTSKIIAQTAKESSDVPLSAPVNKLNDYQPMFDPMLPAQNWLKIPSIGVDTSLQEASYENFEDALKKGVWRAPDEGTPPDRGRPTILAAHRFGYLVWSNIFRRQSSFYNLPKLGVGDVIEIDWNQRKYLYEVFAESKGEKIAGTNADLILYTCESLNGPIRIFKYARLIEI